MDNDYDWFPYFAWWPVRVSGELIWLQWVMCRHVGAIAPDDDLTDYWEYRKC